MKTSRSQHPFSSRKRLRMPSCIQSCQFRLLMTRLPCFCHQSRTPRWHHFRIKGAIFIVLANSPQCICGLKKWTLPLIRSRVDLRMTKKKYDKSWRSCTRGTWHYRQNKATCTNHSTQPTPAFVECQPPWNKTSQYLTESRPRLTAVTGLE